MKNKFYKDFIVVYGKDYKSKSEPIEKIIERWDIIGGLEWNLENELKPIVAYAKDYFIRGVMGDKFNFLTDDYFVFAESIIYMIFKNRAIQNPNLNRLEIEKDISEIMENLDHNIRDYFSGDRYRNMVSDFIEINGYK